MNKFCSFLFFFFSASLFAEAPIIFCLGGKNPDEYKKFSGLYSFSDSLTSFDSVRGRYVVVLRGNIDKRFFVSFLEPDIGEINYINRCDVFEIKIIDSRNPIGDGRTLVRILIDGFVGTKDKKVLIYTSRGHVIFNPIPTVTGK